MPQVARAQPEHMIDGFQSWFGTGCWLCIFSSPLQSQQIANWLLVIFVIAIYPRYVYTTSFFVCRCMRCEAPCERNRVVSRWMHLKCTNAGRCDAENPFLRWYKRNSNHLNLFLGNRHTCALSHTNTHKPTLTHTHTRIELGFIFYYYFNGSQSQSMRLHPSATNNALGGNQFNSAFQSPSPLPHTYTHTHIHSLCTLIRRPTKRIEGRV